MKLEQSFEVAAPLERVWAALIDVEHVAPCLPGASVTGRNEDGSFNGSFKVKIGPTSAAYSGKLLMEDVDESAHTATMNASGTDKRGQGGAKALIVSKVSEGSDGATRVEVVTDYHITGRLARFGRGGMIEEISNRLLNQFADNLQASLLSGEGEAAAGTTAPAAGTSTPTAETSTPTAGTTAPVAETSTPAAETAPEPSATEPAPAVPPATPDGQPTASAPPQSPTPPASQTPPGPPPPPRPPVESEPVEGLSLMASVLAKQIRSNPGPVIALVIGFLVALRVLRRR